MYWKGEPTFLVGIQNNEQRAALYNKKVEGIYTVLR